MKNSSDNILRVVKMEIEELKSEMENTLYKDTCDYNDSCEWHDAGGDCGGE